MIKDFSIKNYKSLKDITFNSLNRINVFIGDNNAGKSNVLEALMLYASNLSLDAIKSVLDKRGDDTTFFTNNSVYPNPLINFSPIVYNYDIGILQNEGISIGDKNKKVTLKCMQRVVFQSGSRGVITLRSANNNRIPVGAQLLNSELVLVNERSRGANVIISLQQPIINQSIVAPTPILPYHYVICPERRDISIDSLWGNITMTPLQPYVLKALKIIEPHITNFNITRNANNQIIPKITIDNNSPIPLYSMGDGVCHILNIVLALLNSKDGMLLLDEVDSGLHYTKHQELWRIILELSQKLNVQIFASTHSSECLRAFASICMDSQNQSEGTIYIIRKDESGNITNSSLQNMEAIDERAMLYPDTIR